MKYLICYVLSLYKIIDFIFTLHFIFKIESRATKLENFCEGRYIAIPVGSYWLHDLHIKRIVRCYYKNAPAFVAWIHFYVNKQLFEAFSFSNNKEGLPIGWNRSKTMEIVLSGKNYASYLKVGLVQNDVIKY